jgi:hypothetical protein
MGSQEDSELALQPPEVKVEDLVMPGGVDLRGVQLQFLESLVGCVEAGGERRLGRCQSPHKLPLYGDDEVQGPETHMHAWDPVDAVASHPKPDESDEMHKASYLVCQLLVF